MREARLTEHQVIIAHRPFKPDVRSGIPAAKPVYEKVHGVKRWVFIEVGPAF